MRVVTVFGSSAPREGSVAYEEARQLGLLLAQQGFAVANGGYGGLMEATARGAREAGGQTFGVTCRIWPARPNCWIEREIPTDSYLERLQALAERGDAYIVLPGGTGTLAELSVVWEMMNKGTLARSLGGRKPLLVKEPYWQGVIDCLRQESHLAGSAIEADAPALNFVTLFSTPEKAVDLLVEAFAVLGTPGNSRVREK